MSMPDPAAFFNSLRKAKILGPDLSTKEVEGCNSIMKAMDDYPISWVAYALGTAFLETGGTMQPIKEWGGDRYFYKMYDIGGARPGKARELGNTSPGDGVKYCGRGYPQVTGKLNYSRAEAIFHKPFVDNPDLMLEPEIAAQVMAHFMKYGLFTGKKFSDFLPPKGMATRDQFRRARPIINGQDRAVAVAQFAATFQLALVDGGWA